MHNPSACKKKKFPMTMKEIEEQMQQRREGERKTFKFKPEQIDEVCQMEKLKISGEKSQFSMIVDPNESNRQKEKE